MQLIITDSGLGGLSICAAIEQSLREAVSITYVNAWPEQGRGYNDLPDMAARARVFDLALRRMADMGPDEILIACNTLSIVYPFTEFSRTAPVPVRGILDAGVELFREALDARPESSVVLLGTRTTIESGIHRQRLLRGGVAEDRIAAVSCHGLATAIERGPHSADAAALIEDCAARAAESGAPGEPLYAGLCCTHYGMVSEQICAALARRAGRTVLPLDPNGRMVRGVTSRLAARPRASGKTGQVRVEVVSKVALDDAQREGIAALIEPLSPATAAALRAYVRMPGLF